MTPPYLDIDEQHQVTQFLYLEAALLDSGRHREWLELLCDEIRYQMLVTVTLRTGEADPSARMGHFDEDRYSLTKRVERLESRHAWTEDPPSRTRRFVTNVSGRYGPGAELEVDSYLLLFRSRGDSRAPEWLSVARSDRLQRRPDGLRLLERRITVDESVLRTQNLAVFL